MQAQTEILEKGHGPALIVGVAKQESGGSHGEENGITERVLHRLLTFIQVLEVEIKMS